MSAGAAGASTCRRGSLKASVRGGANDARASVTTVSLSCLLALLATGLLTTGEAISTRAAGTLSRPRMLVAAAPATRKQVSAMMVMALVQQVFLIGSSLVSFPTTGR